MGRGVAPSPSRGQLCSTAPGLPTGSAGWTLQCNEMLRAASVPSGRNKASYREGRDNPWREQREQGKAKGTWRKAWWELPSSLASTEPAPSLSLPSPGHPYEQPLQKTPCSYQGWERKDPLWSEFRTVTKHGQDTGIPGGWQAMAVLLRGLR